MLRNFGGHEQFSSQIVTVNCLEDNSYLKASVANERQGARDGSFFIRF